MKKLLLNKKGEGDMFLGEHVANIIIAALGIVILLAVLGLLINLLISSNREDKKAKAELDKLGEAIAILQEDNVGSSEYIIPGLKNWELVGWPYKNMNTAFCSYSGWKNCLCFCKTDWYELSPDAYRKACDEKQICIEIKVNDLAVSSKDSIDVLPIKLEILSTLKITYDKILNKLTIIKK